MLIPDELQDRIRYQLNRFIFDNGFAPTTEQVSTIMSLDKTLIEEGLQALAANHSIVLHPNSTDIWVVPPFALFPTLFWVKTKDKQWWGNCTWCSFGIASLTKTDTQIFTKLKGQADPLLIEIKDGSIIQKDYVVHFPIPARKFWANVIYTCSMMLVFRDEEEIDVWCREHNKPKGEILPIEKVWELAQVWYGYYLNPNFKRKTKEVAKSMFERIGLISNFWKL